MIMAKINSITGGDNVAKEIRKFFTWRGGQSGYVCPEPAIGDWGWLSTYPQAFYYANAEDKEQNKPEQITVGVAQNYNYKLGMLAAMSGDNIMGRSYTHDYPNRYEVEGKDASKWGYNFAEQFNYALKTDPKLIFVTGWNEWAMARNESWPEGFDSAVPMRSATSSTMSSHVTWNLPREP